MEETIKLKPCKLCGGLGKIGTKPFDLEDYRLFQMFPRIEHEDCSFAIKCSHCGATTGSIYTLENAVKVWNMGEARIGG